MTRKTAKEKLNTTKPLPEIKAAPEKWGGGRMLIPHPLDVDKVMKTVPFGSVIIAQDLRKYLANSHGVDICCPMVTGIFINLSAAASEEDRSNGITECTPWWRTLKKGGELNPKYPGGLLHQKKRLEEKGHTVIQKRKRMFLENIEQRLFLLESSR